MAESSIFVLSSRYEGLGLVEAMSCGPKYIITDVLRNTIFTK